MNSIETYAKVAQQQIEANMAELKEMLTRQQALNNPQPSPMDTPSLADLSKIEKLWDFEINNKVNIRKPGLLQSFRNYFWNLNARQNILSHKNTILKVAKSNNIPFEMIGGILYNEANYLNILLDNIKDLIGNSTTGIAQVSPISVLVESDLGFDPFLTDIYLQRFAQYIKQPVPPKLSDILNPNISQQLKDRMRLTRNNIKEQLKHV